MFELAAYLPDIAPSVSNTPRTLHVILSCAWRGSRHRCCQVSVGSKNKTIGLDCRVDPLPPLRVYSFGEVTTTTKYLFTFLFMFSLITTERLLHRNANQPARLRQGSSTYHTWKSGATLPDPEFPRERRARPGCLLNLSKNHRYFSPQQTINSKTQMLRSMPNLWV